MQTHVLPGVLLEWYWYDAGPPVALPRHVHDSYQFGLALDRAGRYEYRGARFAVPVRQVVAVHPGEPHAVWEEEPRPSGARYLMAYLDPHALGDVAPRTAAAEPFFREPILRDPGLAALFARLFSDPTDPLALEGRFIRFAAALFGHAGGDAERRFTPAALPEIARVREYLHAHVSERIALGELAALVGMSRFQLLRAFQREVGLPPHTYQRRLRVDRARHLIAARMPLVQAALESGFVDQSHLGRHFRSVVGVSPGRYVAALP